MNDMGTNHVVELQVSDLQYGGDDGKDAFLEVVVNGEDSHGLASEHRTEEHKT
jgi:hypothetical protein